MENVENVENGYSVRIRNSVRSALECARSEKSPGSPLIRRNLPSVRGWSFEIERIFSASSGSASRTACARSYGRIHSRARSRRVREAVRLKKPYTPGVHRLRVITSADIMRVSHRRGLVASRSYSDSGMKRSGPSQGGTRARARARACVPRSHRSLCELFETPLRWCDRFFRTSDAFDSRHSAQHSGIPEYRSDVYIVSDTERTHRVWLFPHLRLELPRRVRACKIGELYDRIVDGAGIKKKKNLRRRARIINNIGTSGIAVKLRCALSLRPILAPSSPSFCLNSPHV